ncbi:unnamed protein product [Cylicocyclus nassatus]|uniref:CCHC-type domain-containing protein n=1 Tax=Cylicocyclus nassatus TaxID=53992 RepID=A0AA36HD75_CYLNA|nr:unnamed protein product [Cylicocyclus nassatus]
MTVEDEGIEAHFEEQNEPGKNKKKKMKIATNLKTKQAENITQANDVALKKKKQKRKEDLDKNDGESDEKVVTEAKKELKRKRIEDAHGNVSESVVSEKKVKLEGPLKLAIDPASLAARKEKKKQLLKEKLKEGLPLTELIGKGINDLIGTKEEEVHEVREEKHHKETASGETETVKKKKKKVKKNVKVVKPVVAPKKHQQSSSESPAPPETDEDKAEADTWEEDKIKKKKKVKKNNTDNQAKQKEDNKAELKKKKQKNKAAPVKENNVEEGEEAPQSSSAQRPQHNPQKYKELLEKLASIKKEGEARQAISVEINAGKLEDAELRIVLRMWRQQKRRKMIAENKEKLVQMEGSLEEIKKVANDLVRRGKLNPRDAGDIIKRWKAREKRRVERQVSKQTGRACFHCRQRGHVLAECPNRGDDNQVGNVAITHGDGICFKCGSTEHSVHKCPRKNIKGFPYATCFVCGQQGHLSRDCEKNANGIYPDGGGCNVCGSTKHLKRDCPELAAQKQKKEEKNVTIRTMSAMTSADADDIPEDEAQALKKKPKKIVKF